MSIDINSDMGELNHLLADGTYEKLMDHVTSINVTYGSCYIYQCCMWWPCW